MACRADSVCPRGGVAVLNEYSFRNLWENLENTEAYIEQLEELLRGLINE